MKDIHIGKLIEQRIAQVGMTKAEFARRINRSPQNVQDLLTRSSVDTSLLLVICKALGYNFFKAFIDYSSVINDLKKKDLSTILTVNVDNNISDLHEALKQISMDNDRIRNEITKLTKGKKKL